MTLEEKISHLQSAAMEEARAQGNAIIKQHEEALQSVFEQHRAEAVRQSETRLKAETTNARQQLNMAASKAQLELKRELSRTQGELKNKLFDEVLRLIDDYMKTEDYKRLLIAYIENAAKFANGETMTLYLNPSDEDKMAYLQEHTGMTLTVSKEDFIGGIRAVIPGRNILIDHAFKGAVDNEYHKFSFKGGAGIE
ncbi:V-type ATP synthase subunit E [Dorea sp. D27]|uniref:V-type ATP synthase subunit E n=1 Tax=Dorea sp. D27 TaxID=658665 RepID=UPI0006735793|nr:V-type ATP synthase subunit E [Dorea sp. D27]